MPLGLKILMGLGIFCAAVLPLILLSELAEGGFHLLRTVPVFAVAWSVGLAVIHGTWQRRRWAWYVFVTIMFFSFTATLIETASHPVTLHLFEMFIDLVIIVYLFSPRVRHWYGLPSRWYGTARPM